MADLKGFGNMLEAILDGVRDLLDGQPDDISPNCLTFTVRTGEYAIDKIKISTDSGPDTVKVSIVQEVYYPPAGLCEVMELGSLEVTPEAAMRIVREKFQNFPQAD